MKQVQRSLFLVVCFALGIAPGALAEGEPISRVQTQQVLKDIPSINDVEQPLTTTEGLLVQQPAPTPALAQVTGVQLQPIDKGLEVILETTSEFAEVLNSETENSLITDIPNAQLRLQGGGAFRQDNPTQDIASVKVVNLDAKTLRVTVTGKAGVPVAEVSQSPQALILSVVAPPAPSPQPAPPVAPAPVPPPAEPQQPAAPVAPAPEPQAEEELLELTVRAEEEAGGYNVPDASVGTRTDTPLRDIPQSIQVVPQEVLRDQNVTRFEEALRNVSGVTTFGFSTQRSSSFLIRGFFTSSNLGNYLRNGLRDTLAAESPELSNIERIEVLKGPASVLYGGASPGGTINLVTKQPLRDPFYAIDATIGSYDSYRGVIDLSGPLNDSKTVLYRLNASYLDRNSFVDFYNQRQFFTSPVLSLALGERTNLTLEGDFTDTSTLNDAGLPAIGTVLPNPNGRIPRNRLTAEPDSVLDQTIGRVGYRLEHQFSDNWSLQNAFRASFRTLRDDGSSLFPVSLANDNRTLNRSSFANELRNSIYDLAVNLTGEFSTGSIEHQVVFGVDLGRLEQSDDSSTGTGAPIDLFNPVYRQPREPLTLTRDQNTLTDTLGIYVQDQVTLADNLKLLLGGRFDLFEQTNQDFLADTTTNQSGEAFSPRIGIVYQPIEPISVYASYSRSFTPTIGRAVDDSLFEPERGRQYEVGVKGDLNDQISATLAFYDLTRSDVLVADTTPGVPPGNSIQTGKQRSRGIELNVEGEILPGWNIIAGYAYTDAQVTEDIDPERVDNRLNNIPKNAFNVWTTYEIQQGTLQGLGAGLGFFFVGDRQGDLANTFELPSYFRTDAAIFYKRDQFRAALNFRNLFNVNYFETAFSDLRVFYGAPFTVQGTVSWQF